MPDENRNFATNPRTIREAFEVILARRNKQMGLLDGEMFSDGRTDAIGALFTKPQREELERMLEDIGEESTDALFEAIGPKNVRAMTGMSRRQVNAIMEKNDDSVGALVDLLKDGLAVGKVKINNVNFKLEVA